MPAIFIGSGMDFEKLMKLIEIVQNSGIAELEITSGEEKIKIVREYPQASMPNIGSISPIHTQTAYPATEPQPLEKTDKSHDDKDPQDKNVTIRSPMVGTFYRSPSPEDPSFISSGESIKIGDVLCIIEAMKLMNEIESEIAGLVVDILVENGQPVEYGQPLFIIKPL